MHGAVEVYRGSVEAAVMSSLVDAMSRDVKLARSVREVSWTTPCSATSRARRGIERGDLPT
jgi:hypothetical protein